jgi:hypothetical protein
VKKPLEDEGLFLWFERQDVQQDSAPGKAGKMMKLWSDYLDGLKAGAQILPFTKKAGKPNSKTMEQFDQIQKLLNDDIREQRGAVQYNSLSSATVLGFSMADWRGNARNNRLRDASIDEFMKDGR